MIIRRANVGDISGIIFLLQMMHEETVVDIPKINTVKDDKVIGSISGQKNKDWWSDEDYIGDLWYYVMKDYRKSDIAKKLLNHFVKIVKEVKLQLRLGHVFSGDVIRKDKFYERQGFLRIGSIYIEE